MYGHGVQINIIEEQGCLHDPDTHREWYVLSAGLWYSARGIGHPDGLTFRRSEMPCEALLVVGYCEVADEHGAWERAETARGCVFQSWEGEED